MNINLNDEIRLRLTPLGEKIYKEYYRTTLIPYKDEYLNLQIHEFANIFGSYLYNGSKQIVVNNIITIPRK